MHQPRLYGRWATEQALHRTRRPTSRQGRAGRSVCSLPGHRGRVRLRATGGEGEPLSPTVALAASRGPGRAARLVPRQQKRRHAGKEVRERTRPHCTNWRFTLRALLPSHSRVGETEAPRRWVTSPEENPALRGETPNLGSFSTGSARCRCRRGPSLCRPRVHFLLEFYFFPQQPGRRGSGVSVDL